MSRRIQRSWTIKFDGAQIVVINVDEFEKAKELKKAIEKALELIKNKELQLIKGTVIEEDGLQYAHYNEVHLGPVFFKKKTEN